LGHSGHRYNEVKCDVVEMQEVRLLKTGVRKRNMPFAMENETSTIVSVLVPFVKKCVEIAVKKVNTVNDRVK
jgi:hypothetical protein